MWPDMVQVLSGLLPPLRLAAPAFESPMSISTRQNGFVFRATFEYFLRSPSHRDMRHPPSVPGRQFHPFAGASCSGDEKEACLRQKHYGGAVSEYSTVVL